MAVEQQEVSMEELFGEHASQQMVSEANAFKTVPKGVYRLQATQYKATRDPKDNRLTIWCPVDIIGEDGKRLAKSSLKMSPEEGRTAKGFLDGKSKIFGQVLKALYPTESDADRAKHNVGEVVQTLVQTPIQGFVSLTFKGPKNELTGWNDWLDPQTEADEKSYREAGYTPMNVVRSVQAAK